MNVQQLTPGTHVRVAAPQGSRFDGHRGFVERVNHETSVRVRLLSGPSLDFGPSDLQPVAVPTARVGVDFPGEDHRCRP